MVANRKLKNSVLILDNFAQTLAVVRSLGAAGYNTILGRDIHKPIAAYSRFCDEQWIHSDLHEALENTEIFQREILDLLEDRPDIGWIFPVTEISAKVILKLSGVLPPHLQTAMVPETPFMICLDKEQANKNCGLAYPESRVVENLAELSLAAEDIKFPVIIKSVNTTRRVFDRKAYIVHDLDTFALIFNIWPVGHVKLLVQKFITGSLEASDFVAKEGALLAYCEGLSLRTDMLDGTGFGVEFKSVAPTEAVYSATIKFVEALNYSGPGLIQFIKEENTGTMYFVENNPRLSAGVAESIAAGKDIPLLVLQALDLDSTQILKPLIEENCQYQSEFYTHWLSRDIEGYLAQRSSLTKAQRSEWLVNMLRSFSRADAHIMWQWRDPIPGIYLYSKLLIRILRQVFIN